MARNRLRLTPELMEEICQKIKAGAFEFVAAEFLSVPREVYLDWLDKAQGKNARNIYRQFFHAVRQAKAHARLMAETALRQENPRIWLLHGPGRETPQTPGWSATPSAANAGRNESELRAEILNVVTVIYSALKDLPNIRTKVAEDLDRSGIALIKDFPRIYSG